MKDTIKAKEFYKVCKVKNPPEYLLNEDCYIVFDGEERLMLVVLASYEDYLHNKKENECFVQYEVFTTRKGNQYIYWQDTELCIDYITKI